MRKIIFFCLLCTPVFSAKAQEKITLEDIWIKNTFAPKRITDFYPTNDGKHYFSLETPKIIAKYHIETGKKVGELLNLDLFPNNQVENIEDFIICPKESRVLIITEQNPIYRHSFEANYICYDLETKVAMPVSEKGKERNAMPAPSAKWIAFARDNNLYYADPQQKKEVQITTDGAKNEIINGTTDWVYEEEFGFTRGFEWSPNSEQIAFLRFDETRVPEYSFTQWGELYPTLHRYKYPKPGEPNSVVTLHVHDLKTAQILDIPLSNYNDYYIPQFGWIKNNELYFTVLNRHQNRFELNVFNTQSKTLKTLYYEENQTYIEVPALIFTSAGFIISGEKEGYNQLYQYDAKGQFVRKLTPESRDVTAVYGFDEKNKRLYFQTASTPMNREICWVNIDKKTPKTIFVSSEHGVNTAVFSKNYQYFINTHSSANTAPKYTLHDANGKLLKVLEDNAELNQKFKNHHFVEKKFGTILNTNGDEMPYWIMIPEHLEANKKYPLLMFQYSGPASQQVINRYGGNDFLWYQMLVSEGYIVACVDGRGTGGKGETYKKSTYLQLGKYETEDQIAAAKYFGTLDFIDVSRIGIWGWSYGGFMSTNCLLKGNDVFKMAIAVAPVASWRYYDNIYTERFLRTPAENPNGYDENSPINFVEKLKGAYLLVHGTADDNVHLQNTMELIRALNNAGKHYELQLYPNKNHSILGAKSRLHLYQKMTNFIYRNL